MICDSEFAEECGTCLVKCTEPCILMKFIIRHMLWTCNSYTDPTVCENFKDILYQSVIGDFA